ncbi:MAG: RNA polymerase subunit sigma, partial [Deltaproteobacteria bacterium CG17_big_fil_post_rev_8_21_14_2_50_63_7]
MFDGWVEAHAADLYRFAYRLCSDGSLAEDMVQQAFYEAW